MASKDRQESSESKVENLAERAVAVCQRARRYGELRRLAKEQSLFDEQLDSFRGLKQSLHLLFETRSYLAKEGVPQQRLEPHETLRADLLALLESFRADRRELIDARGAQDRQKIRWRLENVIQEWADSTASDWRDYVLGLVPSVPGEILDVLERVDVFRASADKVRRGFHTLHSLAEGLPSSEDALAKARKAAASIGRAWEKLGGEGLPTEVVGFLRAAGTSGAALEQLTPDVRHWLVEHQIESGFIIKMRGDN